MPSSAWVRSGAGRPGSRGARPAGSWAASVARARAAWDGLTGRPDGGTLSDTAAAAILSTALGLWADTAAGMGGDGPAEGDG